MRVLQVHNTYRYRGGEDVVVERERALLQSQGDQVETFQLENHTLKPGIEAAVSTVWSRGSYRALQSEIRRFKPEVVHFHNTLPRVSPSGYYAASGLDVPVVQTLHNFRMACPSGLLFRNGRICEDCIGRRFAAPAVMHRCYRDSIAATAAVAVMLTIHRTVGTYDQAVDAYVALTDFSRGLFARHGLPTDRLHVKPNFSMDSDGPGDGAGGFALFVGRLSAEKGIETLLKAWREHNPGLPLLIAGDGPMRILVEDACQQPGGAIRYLGQVTAHHAADLMRSATMVLFPSEWYETFGLTMIEAYAAGTPVVASRMGTMQCLVEDRRTGRHFAPGDAADLSATVRALIDSPDELASMRIAARAEWERHYSPQANYPKLREVYKAAAAAAHERANR